MNSLELAQLARDVALEAGRLVLDLRSKGVSVAANKSNDIDIVTFADRECEELIRNRISQARPHDGFFGEEGGATAGESGITWVIDPIDGTVNYLYDLPQYGVSIAAVQGEPQPGTWTQLAGVVLNPPSGEMFWAARDYGAFLGEQELRVNSESQLEFSLVATGFAYDREIRKRQGEIVSALVPRIRDLRRAGAASLDLCSVASGRLDAYFEMTTKPWDHAAGSLIVREAGGVVSGYDGRAEGEEMLMAANPELITVLNDALLNV